MKGTAFVVPIALISAGFWLYLSISKTKLQQKDVCRSTLNRQNVIVVTRNSVNSLLAAMKEDLRINCSGK